MGVLDGVTSWDADAWVLSNPTAKGVIDTVWQYDSYTTRSGQTFTDSTNVLGPSVTGEGSITDVLVETEGESHEGELGTKLFLYGILALVVLYLVRPWVDIGATVASGVGQE